MPMTLNVGLSKKVGEANYGSRGATVNLQTELDSGVVNDPDRLRERIRQMFHLARDAIYEELGAAGNSLPSNGNNGNGNYGHSGSGQSHNARNQNGNQGERPATTAQCRALRTITQKQNRDLGQLLQQRFGCNQPEQITLPQASGLIDELNAAKAGNSL